MALGAGLEQMREADGFHDFMSGRSLLMWDEFTMMNNGVSY